MVGSKQILAVEPDMSPSAERYVIPDACKLCHVLSDHIISPRVFRQFGGYRANISELVGIDHGNIGWQKRQIALWRLNPGGHLEIEIAYRHDLDACFGPPGPGPILSDSHKGWVNVVGPALDKDDA